MDLTSKVTELSRYLDDEAIAVALRLTPQAVRDIREGKAEVRQVQLPHQAVPVVHVNSVKTAYRQKVVAVARAKGGVGSTVISIGLAYLFSREIKTLLVSMDLSEGASDLAYYLNLPDCRYRDPFRGEMEQSTVNMEANFHVLQVLQPASGDQGNIGQLIAWARQEYDAIVMDTPNCTGGFVGEAMELANTLVAITSGLESELSRLAVTLGRYARKHIILVANRGELPREARQGFAGQTMVKIEHDSSLSAVFDKGDLPGEKSIFMKGVGQVRDVVFAREKKGVFRTLFGG